MSLGPPDLSSYQTGMPRWERLTSLVWSWRVNVWVSGQKLDAVAYAFTPGSPCWRWWHLKIKIQLGHRVWYFWRFRERRPTQADILKYGRPR